MKITKRILAMLLFATLLVSCMLLSVSAEDPFKAEGISDIEDVMEYYDLEDYLADNYEDGSWNAQYYTGENSEVAADPANESNKVLKVTGKNNKYGTASATDKLVVSFDIYYDSAMNGEYRLDVKVLDADNVESLTYNTIFSVNAGQGVFQYSVWDSTLNNGEGGFVITDFEGITPAADTWYNVVIFFNASEGNFNFKISSDSKASWVYSDSYSLGSAVKMSCFELKSYAKSRSDTVSLYLDNVEVYCGTFERNPANKNNITAQTLIDLEALYLSEETDSVTKVRIAEVFDQLVNKYSYTPEDSTPEIDAVNAIIAKAPEYINLAFAQEIINRGAAIDKTAGYYNRLDYIEASEYYNSGIPADEMLSESAGLSDNAELVEAVINARALLAAEKEDLVKVAEDSEKFVALMSKYDADSMDYDGYLKNFYDTVTSYTYRDDTYAEAVDGVENFTMADAVKLFSEFDAKYTKLNNAANTFIEGATAMEKALEIMAPALDAQAKMNAALEIMNGIDLEDENITDEDKALYDEQKAIYDEQKAIYDEQKPTYEQAFAALSQGYLLADSVYNGGDIDENLDESTHAALTELFDVYLDNKDSIILQIETCEAFLDIMKKAETATYYSAILEHLDAAAECIGNVREMYEGVPEAILLYNALNEAIDGAKSASEAYINAVNAIEAETTFSEKQAAIDAALLLKVEGDVLGIAGVKEANIALSVQMTNLETLIANSENLIALIEEIENAETFVKRRELLAKAEQAASNCEATIEGVADALEAFEELKSDYVSAVQAMNGAHASATEKAADVAGAASSDEDVYKAADVIKNFVG